MKKGFTLVELIGVVVVLGIVLTVIAIPVSDLLESAKNSRYDSYKADIYLACDAYLAEYNEKYSELTNFGGKSIISIEDLMRNDFLVSTIVDPSTGVMLRDDIKKAVIITYGIEVNDDHKHVMGYGYDIVQMSDDEYNVYKSMVAVTFNESATQTEIDEVKSRINALAASDVKEVMKSKMGA